MAGETATIFRTPTSSDPVLAEMVRRLVAAYRPERIYLFGSVARGDAGPDSDYDLMLVVPDCGELRSSSLAEPPDAEGALFHSQQAAEKAMKGFLTWHDVPFRRVHELDLIDEQCAALDQSLSDVMGRADTLTKYAWRFRYPGAPYEPASEEGRAAFELSREVMTAILSRLPPETHP